MLAVAAILPVPLAVQFASKRKPECFRNECTTNGPRYYLFDGKSHQLLAGPVFNEDAILLAEIDLGEITRGKYDFDVVGHYARPDIFQLHVNEKPAPPVIVD